MNRRDIPNLISAARITLVLPIVLLLARRQFGAALAVFAVAGMSDAVDGYLARRYGWFSRLGGWLDPIADKAMLISSYLMLSWLQLIPLWLVAVVIGRDAVIVAGSLVYYYWVEKVDAEPSWISKLNTVAQILLVMVVMFDQGVVALPPWCLTALIYAVTVTVVLSGLGYVWTWSARAVRVKRG